MNACKCGLMCGCKILEIHVIVQLAGTIKHVARERMGTNGQGMTDRDVTQSSDTTIRFLSQ